MSGVNICDNLVKMTPGSSVVVCVCVGCLLFFGILSRIRPKSWEEDEFQFYINKFNKSYINDTEYELRFNAFKKSLDTIEFMNKNRTSQTSALYGITAYSDMLESEFLEVQLQQNYAERLGLGRQRKAGFFGYVGSGENEENSANKKNDRFRRDFSNTNLPRKIDWRARGAITPVNNQHQCGACWAFSAIETIEAMHWVKTGELRALSTQQMIDCARNGNNGCRGGDICTLFHWLVDNDVPIRFEDDYPLHLREEQCKNTSIGKNNPSDTIQVKSFVCMSMIGQEDDLLEGLARLGPVAVAVNAISWQNYLGGVIQHHCGSDPTLMNHAVQIVGYDLDAEIPHYLVRNSWGEDFGHQGYLKIAVGGNLCGIVNEVAAVVDVT